MLGTAGPPSGSAAAASAMDASLEKVRAWRGVGCGALLRPGVPASGATVSRSQASIVTGEGAGG